MCAGDIFWRDDPKNLSEYDKSIDLKVKSH